MDELAHSNLLDGKPAPRHAKRWQDVEEMLEAGLDVWATLNVQHIESLNDVVAAITGVRQQETVPDHVIEEAAEIELIDLPPDDLLERLKQAMQAQKRFIADAAHQLRTPLAGLKTQVELALRENDSERKQHILEQLLTSARRSTHLVNQLLSLARNEPDGQGNYTFTQLDLNQLAQGSAAHWLEGA